MRQVACIVEGQGDEQSLPILIRRIAAELSPPVYDVGVQVIQRIPFSKLVRPGELERAVELSARKAGKSGAVLILADCEDRAPCKLGPELLARAKAARGDIHIGVVLAYREFETWFLAAARSLRGQRGLPADLEPPGDPEAIRGAKEWLGDRMPRKYRETLEQPALTDKFDLAAARQVDSFDKCYREITRLLQLLHQPEQTES